MVKRAVLSHVLVVGLVSCGDNHKIEPDAGVVDVPEGQPLGTIPNVSRPASELNKPITVQMSPDGVHHNQPTVINGYVLLSGDGRHEIWDVSGLANVQSVPYPINAGFRKLADFQSPESPLINDHGGEAESHQVTMARYPNGSSYTTYLATITGTGVDIWDITTPSSPARMEPNGSLVSTLVIPGVNYGDNTAAVWGLSWQGRYLYVGGTNTGVHVVDAINPAAPVLIKSIPVPQMGNVSAGPLFAIGNMLVVTTPKESAGIAKLDISDPVNPVFQSAIKSGTKSYIGGVYGHYAHLLSPFRWIDITADPLSIHPATGMHAPASEYMSFAVRPRNADGSGPLAKFLFLGSTRTSNRGEPGLHLYEVKDPDPDGEASLSAELQYIPGGERNGVPNANIDDQFSTVMGNLVVISDDEGKFGSRIAVHMTAPDRTSPTVMYANPPEGATQQSVKSRIGISFTESIEFTSVTDTSFHMVKRGTTTHVPGTFGSDHTFLFFSPDADLEEGTTYDVVLAAGGVADYVGNEIESEHRFSFTTAGIASTPPATCSINPTTPTAGSSATFSAQNANPSLYVYAWSFGDGGTATGPTSAHLYGAVGRYTVTLTVTPLSGTAVPVACTTTQIVHRPLTGDAPTSSSTIALSGSFAWAVNPDANTITAVNRSTNAKAFEVAAGQHPRTLAAAPNGDIWVVNQDSATITVHVGTDGALVATIPLAPRSQPYGIAFSPDGAAAFVTLQATGTVLRINASTRAVESELSVGADAKGIERQLRGVAVAADSARVFVTRFVSTPVIATTPQPGDEAEVFELNGSTMSLTRTFKLQNSTRADAENQARGIPNYLSSITISPDGTVAWIPSKQDNMSRGTFREGVGLSHDSAMRPVVSRIDLTLAGSAVPDDTTDRIDINDADMPFAAAASNLGDLIFVAVQGNNEVAVFDAFNNAKLATLGTGLAPQGVALDATAGKLYVQNFMGRSMSIFDVSGLLDGTSASATEITGSPVSLVANELLTPTVLLGKRIFYNAHDARVSLESYTSCASCHLDGGADGRVWDFTQRGEGFRNTSDLRGRSGMGQGRVHWTGNFDEIQDFENDMRNAFGGQGFLTPSQFTATTDPLGSPKAGLDGNLDALAAYVASLTTVPPSPYRVGGVLSAAASNGKALITSKNCISCHVGLQLTDSRVDSTSPLHDVGTIVANSGQRRGTTLTGFDTPTLLGLWSNGPYLHNGTAATLAAVLENVSHVGSLTTAEKADLVAYLREADGNDVGVSFNAISPTVQDALLGAFTLHRP